MTQRNAPARRRRRVGGFTLIELLIAVVILAVLAAIAIPTYQSQIRKSRRAEAMTFMSQVQQAQERYRANRTNYGDRFIVPASGALRGVGAAGDTDAATGYTTSGGYYQLALAAVTPTGYAVQASAQGAQTGDASCQFMQMTLAGGNIVYDSGTSSGSLNGPTSTANRRCWNR